MIKQPDFLRLTVNRHFPTAKICCLLIALFALFQPLEAHELTTAYLNLHEGPAETCNVLLRIPEDGNPLTVRFPPGTEKTTAPISRTIDSAQFDAWSVHIPGGLLGTHIEIDGQDTSDLLVRIQRNDGSEQTLRLSRGIRSFTVEESAGQLQVAGTYFGLGVEHILIGIDHLLFVLALLILVKGWKKLTGAITMFTVAHSITLALATLGFVKVPGAPVEAIIALSIIFVAAEIVHGLKGHPGITARAPWIVTLTFGLLHGLGFAGALSEIGLPQHAIPAALLFFNIGVEAGQLLFVAGVLSIITVFRLTKLPVPKWFPWIPPYVIGSVAMFWVIERVGGF